jgi:hypothetical protein
MSRSEPIKTYVTEQTKREVDHAADDSDQSISEWVGNAIKEKLDRRAEKSVSSETRVVNRLERVIDDGRRDLQEVATQIEDLNAKGAAYGVAAFELVADDKPDPEVRNALQTAADRLRSDQGPQDAVEDFDGDGAESSDDDDNTSDTKSLVRD